MDNGRAFKSKKVEELCNKWGSQSAVPRHVQAEGQWYSRAEPSYSQENESQTWRYSRRGGASLQPQTPGGRCTQCQQKSCSADR